MRAGSKQVIVAMVVVLMSTSISWSGWTDQARAKGMEAGRVVAVPIRPASSAEGTNGLVITYLNQGFTLLKAGRCREAIDEFTKVIEINDPEYYAPAAYHNRGIARLSEGDYDRAIADFTEFIRLASESAPHYAHEGLDAAYLNRGVAWLQKGEDDKAVSDFTEAVKANPQNVQAYYNRGLVQMKKKQYDKALADVKEALRLEPSNARYHALLNDLKKILTS